MSVESTGETLQEEKGLLPCSAIFVPHTPEHRHLLQLYSQCLASGQVLDVQYILRQYVNNIGIKTTGKKITSFHWRKALQRGTVSEVGKRKEDMKNVKFLCMNCFR